MSHLIALVEGLRERGIEFISIQDSIDTTTATGQLLFHMIAALAEFERNLIRERTNAGLAAARARGRKGGRPKGLDEAGQAMLKTLAADKTIPVNEICKRLGISRSTFYRYL